MNSLQGGTDTNTLIRNRAFTCPSYSQRTISTRSALSQGGRLLYERYDYVLYLAAGPDPLKHMEGPLVACVIFYFRSKALHVVAVVFKSILNPALPKCFLGIVCEGKKTFGKWNAEAQPIQALICIQVCLHAGGRNIQWHISDHIQMDFGA